MVITAGCREIKVQGGSCFSCVLFQYVVIFIYNHTHYTFVCWNAIISVWRWAEHICLTLQLCASCCFSLTCLSFLALYSLTGWVFFQSNSSFCHPPSLGISLFFSLTNDFFSLPHWSLNHWFVLPSLCCFPNFISSFII